MVKARHDRADGFGLILGGGHAGPFASRDIIGDAANLMASSLDRIKRSHHARANIAGQQCQNFVPPNVMAQAGSLFGKQGIKFRRVDFRPFKQRPGIGIRIGGVDPPDDIGRQTTIRLKTVKCFKGR